MSKASPSHASQATSVVETGDSLGAMDISVGQSGDLIEGEDDKTSLKRGEIAQSNKESETTDFIQRIPSVRVGETLPVTIELRSDPVRGEGLFAARDISVLEPICALPYPIFMAIETQKLPTTCYSCLAVTSSHIPHIKGTAQADINLKACTGCSQAKFCNKECQTQAWKAYHKLECKIFSTFRDNLPPMLIRAVICVVLLKDKGQLPKGYWNTLMNDLVCHEDVWKAAPENNITAMVRDIKFATNSKMSLHTLTKLFWVMRTNSIELPTSVHGGIGSMLDPVFAKLNHSCNANAMLYRPWHASTSGWNLECSPHPEQRSVFATVIPLRDIRAGEELTIFYSDPTSSVDERNMKHRDNYYFDCTCLRCIEDMRTARDIEDSMPIVSAQYESWSAGVLEQLEQLQMEGTGDSRAYNKASEAWEAGLPKYLDYPALYTASCFDQVSLHLAVNALYLGMFDKALLNLLRPYFLIYPSRIPGRHNYSNVHIMFVVLETFDILLGLNCKDKPVNDVEQDDVKQSLRRLSKRGISKDILIYWRQRICLHLKKCLENSAARDLLPLVAQIQDRLQGQEKSASVAGNMDTAADLLGEVALREAFKLSEARWKVVLKETGC